MSEADYEPMEKPGDEWHRQADEWTKEANDFRGANMNKHDGGHGFPVEVECGPISEVKEQEDAMTEKGPFDAEVHFRCIVDKPKERRLFDAVTEVLRGYIAKKSRHGGFDKATENLIAEFTVAIRFLEAAGKVDKEPCLQFMSCINEDEEVRGDDGRKVFPLMQIRALFESLPETATSITAKTHKHIKGVSEQNDRGAK